jgi:hypothetical protein
MVQEYKVRLVEYIEQQYKDDYHIKMFGLIEKILRANCIEMLKLSWDSGRFLYRGLSREVRDYVIFKPRTDRKPANTPKEIHEVLDNLLYKKFGWRPRSEGVFCIADSEEASDYGYPMIVFPYDGFKYIWVPTRDSYISISDPNKDEKVENLLKGYTDTNITKALRAKYEITIKCSKYMAINQKYSENLKHLLKEYNT